jgi:hypothetical protein
MTTPWISSIRPTAPLAVLVPVLSVVAMCSPVSPCRSPQVAIRRR